MPNFIYNGMRKQNRSVYMDSSSEYEEISNEEAESKKCDTVSSNIHQPVKELMVISLPIALPGKRWCPCMLLQNCLWKISIEAVLISVSPF